MIVDCVAVSDSAGHRPWRRRQEHPLGLRHGVPFPSPNFVWRLGCSKLAKVAPTFSFWGFDLVAAVWMGIVRVVFSLP